MRTETEIFKDLENLCTKPGYAYVIACLNFRDNFITFNPANIKSDDFLKLYDYKKLIPTEISMLIGLAVKGEFKTNLISPEKIKHLAKQTDRLMEELHEVVKNESSAGLFGSIKMDSSGEIIPPKDNSFEQAHIWREPIFYASEQAYTFQYREFAPLKYIQDNKWLQKHKGFCIQDVQTVVKALHKIQFEKINFIPLTIELAKADGKEIIVETLPFDAFKFTLDEVVKQSNCLLHTVESVVKAFCLKPSPCNQEFNRLGDFNSATASPIIKISNNEYLLLQCFKLIEAMYESPFYWMIKDKDYRNIASKHRGEFTEQFCADRLKPIFGEQNVHKNVSFANNKGEIDVLVTYSDRAIILQAKSKKLTVEARKGNDNALKSDFQDAIQDAYNQGFRCAELLNNKKINLLDVNGKSLKLRRNFREIYIFTVVSDHYPSLSYQANHLLKFETTNIIPPPFVMDIFFLDVLCELIQEPVYFLDFVQRRIKYFNRVLANDELTILAHHLKHNLYVPDDIQIMFIESDFCTHIDRVMNIRRENLPGDPDIEGILTKFKDRRFGKLIEQIGQSEQDGILELSFFLLHGDGNSAKLLEDSIEEITRRARADKKVHDFSIKFNDTAGLTFHASYLSKTDMFRKLHQHCTLKKYQAKAEKWFGLAKNANSDRPFDINLVLDEPWEYSSEMEEMTNIFASGKLFPDLQITSRPKKKIGRNELCSCGSGKKFKKCCLLRKESNFRGGF